MYCRIIIFHNINYKMYLFNHIKTTSFLAIILFSLSACNGKLPGADARKYPADPKKRVEQNLKEGRGFRLNSMLENEKRGGVFDFASSNELWRASLDVISFMPLASANYSGGIIITDWYSNEINTDESIKISIRFLTNEIRSDALKVNIFKKNCKNNMNCKITESNDTLSTELIKQILKKATIYKKENEDKEKQKKKI